VDSSVFEHSEVKQTIMRNQSDLTGTYEELSGKALKEARAGVFLADIQEELRKENIYNVKLQLSTYRNMYSADSQYIHFWFEGEWISETLNQGLGTFVHPGNGTGTAENIAWSIKNSIEWYLKGKAKS
jgi:hypothetical protein